MHCCAFVQETKCYIFHYSPPTPSYSIFPHLSLSCYVSVTLSLCSPPTLGHEECVEAVSTGLGCLCPWLKVSIRACFTLTSGKSFQCCSSLRLFQVDGDSSLPPLTACCMAPILGLYCSLDLLQPPLSQQQPLSFYSSSSVPKVLLSSLPSLAPRSCGVHYSLMSGKTFLL